MSQESVAASRRAVSGEESGAWGDEGGVANFVRLNDEARLRQISDLVARKLAGPEKATLDDADVAFHESEVSRLRRALEEAGAASSLAEEPTAKEALHDLLLRIRLRKE